MKQFDAFADVVVDIKRKPTVTKKPKVELYPIAKVEVYQAGNIKDTYWVINQSDGTEVQFPSYQKAEEYQQAHKI